MVKASKVYVRNTVATITANRMASPHWPNIPRFRCATGTGPTYALSLKTTCGIFTQEGHDHMVLEVTLTENDGDVHVHDDEHQ